MAKALASGFVSRTEVLVAERALNEARRDLAILESRRGSFEDQRGASEGGLAAALFGDEAAPAPANTTQLVQTNITRFGTLLVIFFFISILIPIFRYNVELGAYYDARADALLLFRSTRGQDVAALVSLLTPTLAFDKAPTAPDQPSIGVVKELLRATAKR